MRGTRPNLVLIAPQAQLFETAKDRRVETKALFKQIVKFMQIALLGSNLGNIKGGPCWCKIEFM